MAVEAGKPSRLTRADMARVDIAERHLDEWLDAGLRQEVSPSSFSFPLSRLHRETRLSLSFLRRREVLDELRRRYAPVGWRTGYEFREERERLIFSWGETWFIDRPGWKKRLIRFAQEAKFGDTALLPYGVKVEKALELVREHTPPGQFLRIWSREDGCPLHYVHTPEAEV